MGHESLSLKDFQLIFATEQACLDHLFKLRWPDGYRCPRCDHSHYYFHRTRRLFQCGKCRYQASVTAGTVFHKTRTPLVNWFWMIFIMARQKSGVSMLGLQSMLGMPCYKTVWTMAHKIRKAMADRDADHQLARVIETSEFVLAGRDRRPKARPSRILVTVGRRVDHSRFAEMKRVAGASDPIHASVSGVDQGSPEQSAGESESPDKGGDHRKAPPSGMVRPERQRPRRLRWARVLASNFRGNIRGVHHGVSAKHLHRYLAEFTFRFNRRLRVSELFNRTAKACVLASAVSFAELTY